MSWIRIDDHFYDHPKWATADGDSIAMWLAAMAWCNRNESFDGYIPAHKIAGLIKVRNAKATCADLVKREALSRHGDGFLIRNYAEWQQNEKVKAIREKRAENGKKGAAARWGQMANGMASAIANANAGATDPAWQTDGKAHGNEDAPPPTTHSAGVSEQLDNSDSLRMLSLSANLYAQAVYDSDPAACTKSTPERYMAGIAKNARGDHGDAVEEYLRRHPHASALEIAQTVMRAPRVPTKPGERPVGPSWFLDPGCTEHGSDGMVTMPDGGAGVAAWCPCRRSEPYPEPPEATVIAFKPRTEESA